MAKFIWFKPPPFRPAPDHFDAPRRKRIGVHTWQTVPWQSVDEIEAYRRDVLHLEKWTFTYWDFLKFDIAPSEHKDNRQNSLFKRYLSNMSQEEQKELLEKLMAQQQE